MINREARRSLKQSIPADSVPFHAIGLCPACGKEINVAGLWPTAWGPRPGLSVKHMPNGSHQPEFDDARPVTPGLLRKRPRGN